MTTRSARRRVQVNTLPIDNYARRSVGFDDEHAMNEALQHKSNRRGIEGAGRVEGLVLSDGISAWDEDKYRKDWDHGVKRMEAGESGGMSVWQLDRFTRQMAELEDLFRRTRGLGCVLISMGMTYELDNPMHRRMLRMMTGEAQGSSDNTSFKVVEKLAEQREQGWWNGAGRRPFGHPGLLPGKGKRRKEVPHPQVQRERAAVAEAYRVTLLGTRSLQQIADAWNEDGLTGTQGGEWTNVTVRQVLMRPIHAGLLWHDGEIVGRATNVSPIVDEETYYAVRALFSGRKRGGAQTITLCSGIVECSECGNTLISRPRNGVPAYLCAKDRHDGCGRVVTFALYMDTWMRELVVERLSDPAVAANVSAALSRASEEAAELTAQLAKDSKTMTKLGEELANGMAFEVMQAAAGPINKRMTEARARLAELASVTSVETEAEDRSTIEAAWDQAGVHERREMVRDATRGVRVVIYPGRNVRFAPEHMAAWTTSRVQVIPQDSPLG